MPRYLEATGLSRGRTKIVAELDRVTLTRLFRGAFRIYDASPSFPACAAIRFYVSPIAAEGELGIRIDYGDGSAQEFPVTIGGQGAEHLWLYRKFPDNSEIYVFVLPPGHMDGKPSAGCARIWLLRFPPGSTSPKPGTYAFVAKQPGAAPAIPACPAMTLPPLGDIGAERTLARNDDEEDLGEGYHED